ncbi:hypothetical protein BDV96DRAFT_603054 [Lophiotrema nucula]|uniref:ER transporter 6TM N-terminal domain-containing protein n=1 Tax=Lophiotrema nucula TaxID=690887 RepID=A0A6A5YW59_9PLEO|nr:hypothetical protein BDV96DRAFT_603054 [Lophiotrema nucula]
MASPMASSPTPGREEEDIGFGHTRDQPEEKEEISTAATNGHAKKEGTNGQTATATDAPKKTSKIATLWGKLELDIPTALMMMKAGIPPTIALAMYQATDVAETYTTLGYLIAIISILGFCIMPRAKFIQTMSINLIAVCVGAAVAMLETWSGVKAREHTTAAGSPPQRYNSSQSAVCGVWLFFQIWLINSVKAKLPQMAFPSIIYAIFTMVASIYGPQFLTTAQAEAFVKRLLISFLTGLALATGTSLFIIPVTCRKVVAKEMTGYVMALRGLLQAHKKYLQSLETTQVFSHTVSADEGDAKKHKKEKKPKNPEAEAIEAIAAKITELHGKLHGDLPFAKREVAVGKMTPDDFEGIFKHLRLVMMPLMGLGSLMDIFDRAAEINHWDSHDDGHKNSDSEARRKETEKDWHEIMVSVHDPIAEIIQAMDQGLEHTLLRFQFAKPPKKEVSKDTDPEERGDLVRPGDDGFAAYLEHQCDTFYEKRGITLWQWIENRGIKLRKDFFEHPESEPVLDEIFKEPSRTRHRQRRQLYTLLYIVFLLNSISRAVLDFVRFADEHDQAKAKTRFIWPGKKRFSKWIMSTFKPPDSTRSDETMVTDLNSNSTTVYLGSAYSSKKDPEHLPPSNAWEKFGNVIRKMSNFLRSPESSFGFRCACATMSIAIVAYLRDTQAWFVEQRLVWAMIMVAISMTPTSGQSYFSFLLRIVGTVIAMVAAFLVWYMPDQHTAGILVFLWVFVSIGFWVPLKKPQLVIVGLISVVTTTLIIGYELEVRKIGIALASSNGQPYYEIYKLGPYRLATVAGGLFVAFIWTFFPFPISEHSALRQKLGGALYLSANFYSIVHETVLARIRDDEGDIEDPKSPGYALQKARNKVFAKQMLLLQGLRMHSAFVRWEVPLGGKFPVKEYDAIIQLVSNIVNYTALLVYASATFAHPSLKEPDSSAQWFQDFRKLIKGAELTSHEVTSMLALLSSSIQNGQPLPPYLSPPKSYQLNARLEQVDRDILSVKHLAEPGYAAFAVMQISTRCINMDLEKLLK